MPDMIEVGFSLAYLEFNRSGSKREVDDYFRGLSLAQANSPAGIMWRKWWLVESGNFTEAIRLEKQDPVTTAAFQDVWFIVLGTAFAAAAQGDPAEARHLIEAHYAACKNRLAREPDNTDMLWILGMMEALLGNRDEALRLAGRAVELVPKSLDAVSSVTATNRLAIVYLWTGKKDLALAEASRLLRTPFGGMTVHMMRHDPFWFPLRGDPRFEALLNDPKNNAPLF
jgi:tetratricopeptide (TPR) repeat protein